MRYRYQVAIIKIAKFLGCYNSFTTSEQQCIEEKPVPFIGDSPLCLYGRLHIGDSPQDPKEVLQLNRLELKANEQYRLKYLSARPDFETVHQLIYTPLGMGWIDGVLHQRFSLLNPYIFKAKTLRSMLSLFIRPKTLDLECLEQGTVVEADVINTFGDWVIDYLARLTSADIISPLILPQEVADKSYVRDDLERLGIDVRTIDSPILIKEARVIRKTQPGLYWSTHEVESYRKAFDVELNPPRPGSIIYLSRAGVASEAGKKAGSRVYPNDIVASVVEEFGGKVIITNDMNEHDYRQLARDAETVIADHGGAMCRLLLWQTKNVIELFSNEWWSDCYLFLGEAAGVENHALVTIDDFNAAEFRQKLVGILQSFQAESQ